MERDRIEKQRVRRDKERDRSEKERGRRDRRKKERDRRDKVLYKVYYTLLYCLVLHRGALYSIASYCTVHYGNTLDCILL